MPPQSKQLVLPLQNEVALLGIQFAPRANRQTSQLEIIDPYANEPECGMADCGCHAPDLAVFAFDQFKRNPRGGDSLSATDGRLAWRQLRLRMEQSRFAAQCSAVLNDDALLQAAQRCRCGNSFYLRPILALVRMSRLKKQLIELRFIAQQQQAFRVRVQSADRITLFRETKISEWTVG